MTAAAQAGLRDAFMALPAEERRRRIGALSDEEAFSLCYDWSLYRRASQAVPKEPWSTWVVMAGRGFGKTRVGSEQVRAWVRDSPIVNLIGPTAADIRDVMVQGTGAGSAIMEVCPPGERPLYEPSKRKLTWPNGAVSKLFSAEEPERLRGPQEHKLWCDELPAWQRQQETWDLAQFGLRLGPNPQAIITTTPKPTKTLKSILKDPDTVVTRGTTGENARNLSAKFLKIITRKYQNTRLGRQELDGELLEDNPKALWKMDALDILRRPQAPKQMRRVVYGVDPAVSAKQDSDETGIIGAGLDFEGEYWVFDDRSGIYTPAQWAKEVMAGFRARGGDRVVAEVNNGGDLVEANIRTEDRLVPYKSVHASKGKTRRAEPIAALYEQGLVHHVGNLAKLESEMTNWDPSMPDDQQDSPNRMDALVWALWELADLGRDAEADVDVEYHAERVSIAPELDEMEARW